MKPNKILIDALLSEFSVRLEPFGFSPRLRHQEWRRRSPHGAHILHASIANYEGGLGVLMSAAVKIEAVEKLVKPGAADTSTIGTFLENLAGLPPLHYGVASIADVHLVSENIVGLVVRFGEPFFTKYSDPASVLALLMSDERLAIQCSPSELYRTMSVCALLKLDGRNNEAAEYIARHLPDLRRNERPRLLEFAKSLGLAPS